MANAQAKRRAALMWGVAITTWLQIWLDHRWPGSAAYRLLRDANLLLFLVWFGSQIWAGYWRRRPHWTRESWHRYLWLTWMPVAAAALFLTAAYVIDPSVGVFGRPAPIVGIVILLGLMLFGALGGGIAVGWLTDGEPSEQFTRTRWFQGRSKVRS